MMKGYSLLKKDLKSHHSETINIDLQMNLLNTWNKHQVPQYYQDIFLLHLDELQPKAAEAKIKRQIANTIQKRSHYYLLQYAENDRQSIMRDLEPYLYIPTQQVTPQDLSAMCAHVSQLRYINLRTAQTILKMHEQYKCVGSQGLSEQLIQYSKLISNLQQQTQMVRNSSLKAFIPFQQGFDPFFMDYYQFCHRDNRHIQQPIKQLYSMSISQAYRLMRIKDQLLDLRSSNRQSTFSYRKARQSRIRSLPTLAHDHSPSYQIHNRSPVKIYPVTVFRGDKSSRTTLHPLKAQRIETSYTEDYTNPKLSKAIQEVEVSRPKKYKAKAIEDYPYSQQRQLWRKRKHELQSTEDFLMASRAEDYISRRPSRQIYNKKEREDEKDINKMKTNVHLKPLDKLNKKFSYQLNLLQPTFGAVKNYNPIKRESFEVVKEPIRPSNKYDYSPNKHTQPQPIGLEQKGFDYEQPVPRMINKNKFMIHKKSFALYPPAAQASEAIRQTLKVSPQKPTSPPKKVLKENQQVQTQYYQQPQIDRQPQLREKGQEIHRKYQQRATQPRKKIPMDSDEVVEDEDIIDARPIIKGQAQPLIRVIQKPKQTTRDQSPSPRKNNSSKFSQEEKKQIKMKIGKYNIEQAFSLLAKADIQPQYRSLFDIQKLKLWIKINQTYLVEFCLNEACAVIALCSPVPNIGMALKLWAPIGKSIDFSMSNNLFTKYIQFVEKSTTVDKILYSGDGQDLKQLGANGFKMKKQKLYERLRLTKSTKSQSQFKPFIYIECSTVNFKQPNKQNMLYSQQIEQFSTDNYLIAPFIERIGQPIPIQLQTLAKATQKVASFAEVNKILERQGFDEYEASQIKVSNIDVLRFYLNSPLKSSFVANEGLMRLNGSLLYEKGKQCLIGVGLIKNNGSIYFGQNMCLDQMVEKSSKSSNNKVWFWVKMFSKKLYGKLVKSAPGVYGNWQINLIWQDEMQGKIKHIPQTGEKVFANDFAICIQLEKTIVYGASIGTDDFLY